MERFCRPIKEPRGLKDFLVKESSSFFPLFDSQKMLVGARHDEAKANRWNQLEWIQYQN